MKTLQQRVGIGLFLAMAATGAHGQVLSGKFVTPTSGAVANGTLQLRLSQAAQFPGSFAIVPITVSCYTSIDGSVVGVPNPPATPTGDAFAGVGTLPAGTYYVKIAYTAATSTLSLASPEAVFGLSAAGEIVVNTPSLQPAAATGYEVFIGTSPRTETLQGTVTGWSSYTQSVPLVSGAAPPGQNTTLCEPAFNDTVIPTGTYYTATLSDSAGNVVPGFPQSWYLGGGGVEVSRLTPLATNPAVSFPMPLLLNPASPEPQSVNSALNMNLNPIYGTSNIGPGFYGAFWAGNLPAAGTTLATWTPNENVLLRRFDINAQTAGSGGTAGTTVTITDGTSTCTFSGLLTATATSTSAIPQNLGNGCAFDAEVPLTVKIGADDHSSAPSNVSWSVEMTSR